MVKMFGVLIAGCAVLTILGFGPTCNGNENSLTTSDDSAEPCSQKAQEGMTGRVRDRNGEPVEGAFVQVRSFHATGPPVPEIAILTDAHGKYVWPLSPGSYQVTVSADGYLKAAAMVTVEAEHVVTVNFILEGAP